MNIFVFTFHFLFTNETEIYITREVPAKTCLEKLDIVWKSYYMIYLYINIIFMHLYLCIFIKLWPKCMFQINTLMSQYKAI